ncbi:MAG: hypothetical protein JWN07_391 [Hyphomicrobiales bacterium]|nr:hypothetical protein [Hyphomicrobiales bacterium]
MAQDVIDQLQELCGRLREQLMQQPEYRALVSLEKTIEDLSIYMDAVPAPLARAHAQHEAPPAFDVAPDEPQILDVNAMDTGLSMRHGADHMADALADALRAPKAAMTARTMDHLPSHRVA